MSSKAVKVELAKTHIKLIVKRGIITKRLKRNIVVLVIAKHCEHLDIRH
jgi:hypothetical protein